MFWSRVREHHRNPFTILKCFFLVLIRFLCLESRWATKNERCVVLALFALRSFFRTPKSCMPLNATICQLVNWRFFSRDRHYSAAFASIQLVLDVFSSDFPWSNHVVDHVNESIEKKESKFVARIMSKCTAKMVVPHRYDNTEHCMCVRACVSFTFYMSFTSIAITSIRLPKVYVCVRLCACLCVSVYSYIFASVHFQAHIPSTTDSWLSLALYSARMFSIQYIPQSIYNSFHKNTNDSNQSRRYDKRARRLDSDEYSIFFVYYSQMGGFIVRYFVCCLAMCGFCFCFVNLVHQHGQHDTTQQKQQLNSFSFAMQNVICDSVRSELLHACLNLLTRPTENEYFHRTHDELLMLVALLLHSPVQPHCYDLFFFPFRCVVYQ